ncbi:cytochrome P450 [Mycolicibacterium duvalii]|uniref:Steroid C26-monooxygenase n=1 Tax=Mycolicibacterium duvalii TaxID=39688 RepID=A0A7I7JXQ7_9MYCO|nr:cytochrome P450 [Mycolicibacterium duvalii]MCV7369389.1 cytochrome P450 [Mycolicibacterium duvalii]PEG40560.1 cytochrome P450 [Mycolicibacterium duvalii]BBX16108.1 cytochrome P450 monooxygenase [Mycolicibacterium duvalii]
MAGTVHAQPYYDPFDFGIDDDPYPVWKQLRDSAPLYHNDRYGFYALSRYSDVARQLVNWRDFRSGRGTVIEVLLNGIEVPPGVILFEDPPIHDLHRRLMSGVFTPRRMAAIEPMAREFCRRALEPLAEADTFDFIADLGAWMPMRTIGYLLGIPEDRQVAIRQNTDNLLNLDRGEPGNVAADMLSRSGSMLEEFIDWRYEHPSDDLMTDLVNAEIEEVDGRRRRLTRGEVLTYAGTVVGAGNETTTRLLGFAGQLLSDHPDQRRALAADFSLIPNAVEEVLRYEAPSPVQARYVARDVELYGQTVPEGSVMLLLNGSANRDERQYPDPDRFDIRRKAAHLSFGHGIHFCLGAALARVQARVALEEVLTRWPDWEVDYGHARRAHTTSVRGWATLPVRVR